MRRIIIISIIVILLAALGAGLYFLLAGKPSASNGLNAVNNSDTGQLGTLPTVSSTANSSTLPDYLGQASDFFSPLPTSTYISIGTAQGTIQVNNFYLSNPPVNSDEDIVIKQTANYYIVYDPSISSFWLGIIGTPFEMWRAAAEDDFLTTLGVSKTDACKLKVTSGAVYSPGNPDDGQSFPISFCGGGVF